ncbi:MAG: crossover junction endodeoxyribonuclease RuvC [Rhizobiales bacterium]|nr:crossover junction endodeoxyribonuclease RuvC [Hyphomicrobiales bacterium]NRB14164.1 crossover junction endodeoxyribonuclease RuvC [Hyphomicrobiales bacterium]
MAISKPHSVRIIGIDPGLRNMGWGIIDSQGSHLKHVANGVIKSDGKLDLATRLCQLHDQLYEIIAEYKPDESAVENTFVNKDPAGALKLGQARGIALVVPARFGLLVAEYAPNKVKKTVVGAGHADKLQILHMLKILLPNAAPKNADAADALAIAITHAQYRGVKQLKVVG